MTGEAETLFDHPSLKITQTHLTSDNISIPMASITKIDVDRTASSGCANVFWSLLIFIGVGLPLTAVIWFIGIPIMIGALIFFVRALGQSFNSGIDIIVRAGTNEGHTIYRGQPSDLSLQIIEVLKANTNAVFENHVK